MLPVLSSVNRLSAQTSVFSESLNTYMLLQIQESARRINSHWLLSGVSVFTICLCPGEVICAWHSVCTNLMSETILHSVETPRQRRTEMFQIHTCIDAETTHLLALICYDLQLAYALLILIMHYYSRGTANLYCNLQLWNFWCN